MPLSGASTSGWGIRAIAVVLGVAIGYLASLLVVFLASVIFGLGFHDGAFIFLLIMLGVLFPVFGGYGAWRLATDWQDKKTHEHAKHP